MSRIFKNSTFKMQLLVADDINTSIDGLSFKFHTTDPNIYVEVFDNYTLKANIAILTIGSTLFSALDEGVLTYEVRGYFNGEYVTIERQSNYFLKYSNSIPQVNLQEKTIGFIGNGYYEIYPDEGYNGMSKVNVHVDTPAQGGGSCNLGPLNAVFEDRQNGDCWWYAEEQGLDGFNYVQVNGSAYGSQKYEEGYNQGYVDGQEFCQGGGGASCKLQDRWMTPNFDNIINDNLLIVSPVDDGNGPYDGMSRVVITRTEASAPNLMYGVYRGVYDDALSQGETILSHMSNYINENNGSLNGFFDDGEFINTDWKRYMAFTLGQGWYDSRLTDMSYMYNGDGIVPITAFYGFNCENTETIEGAFNGWTKLYALEKLFMLGNSFRHEQTLDLSMTNLNNNPNTKCLIKELYDFKYGGHNQYDVTTSYIKGLSNFRQDIEERGWQCID